jgi:hypothetical protein
MHTLPTADINTPPTTDQPSRSAIITGRHLVIDQNLPTWARRSNPIVKRELGQYWKRLFPNLSLVARVIGVQALLILLLPVGFLMTITLPIAVVSVMVIPVAAFLYGRTVVGVISTAAGAMVGAQNNYTLDLLRVSLVPLDHILLGKVAASLWRQMDDIDLILLAAMIGGVPMLTVYYFAPLGVEEVTLGVRVLALLGVAVLPARVLLEPFMLGAVAVAMGTVSSTRAGAVVTVTALGVFYYAITLLPYAARLPNGMMLLVTVVLPILLPTLIATGAIQFAMWRVHTA